MKDRKGKNVTWKSFWSRWWKGIQEVQLFKQWKQEVNRASKIYNETM